MVRRAAAWVSRALRAPRRFAGCRPRRNGTFEGGFDRSAGSASAVAPGVCERSGGGRRSQGPSGSVGWEDQASAPLHAPTTEPGEPLDLRPPRDLSAPGARRGRGAEKNPQKCRLNAGGTRRSVARREALVGPTQLHAEPCDGVSRAHDRPPATMIEPRPRESGSSRRWPRASSFLSPCVLPLVPGYLSAVSGVLPPSSSARRCAGCSGRACCSSRASRRSSSARPRRDELGATLNDHSETLEKVSAVLIVALGALLPRHPS